LHYNSGGGKFTLRIFEIILYVLLIVTAVRIFFHLPKPWRRTDLLLGAALIAAAFLHGSLEGARWQMIPIYGLVGLVLLIVLPAVLRSSYRGKAVEPQSQTGVWKTLALKTVFLVLVVSSSLLPILLPVPLLPAPRGPHEVGTEIFFWMDESRLDPYDGQVRRLMVQAWYPAEGVQGAERAPYFENLDIAAPIIAGQFGLPSFLLNHMNLVKSYSLVEAPVFTQDGPYPVLLFSHGWTGIRGQNTYQMEELASQGYVIFAADHTYGAAVVVFPGGEVVLNYSEALPEGVTQQEYDRAARVLGQAFVGDLVFLLDQAERLQNGEIPSRFKGHLDVEQVGALGHSTGGGAAIEFCYLDERCRASLAMDAWMIPYDREIAEQGLDKPLLLLQSEGWTARRNPPLVEGLFENMDSPAYRVTIRGTQHYDFADLTLVSPLATMAGFKGPLPTYRVMDIVRSYSTAFFDRALEEGEAYNLDDLSEEIVEVEVEAIRR
jgi:dienelactone hydrolase